MVLPPWTTCLRDRLVKKRARDADRVDAVVAVEVGVLGGEERETHVSRHAIERHQVAPLDVELADHGAVIGEDARRDRAAGSCSS